MNSRLMVGTRVPTDAQGQLPLDAKRAGHYGRLTTRSVREGQWQVTCPDGTTTVLDGVTYFVLEHPDGTISVNPKINLSRLPWKGWVGWLKGGVFIEAVT